MIRVYRYSLRPPHEGAALVDTQIRLAHHYQHTLTTIERARRRAYVAARRRLVGDLDLAEQCAETARAWLTHAREHVSRLHSEQRSKRTPPEVRARVDALRAASKDLHAQAKVLKQAARAHEGLRAEAAAIEERGLVLRKAARATCGVYWGTYLLIEQACDQARKASTDPAYRRLVPRGYVPARHVRGEGSVSAQLQGGLPWAGVLACADSRLRVDRLPDDQWSTRSGRRRAFATLRLRVGSEGRDPVWAAWSLYQHRPLPAEALVKRATVSRRIEGTRERWSLELTVDLPDPSASKSPLRAAVHLGWRARPHSLRVAYVVSDVEPAREVLLPKSVQRAHGRERGLRSLISSQRDVAIALLRAWVQHEPRCPAWLRARAVRVRSDMRLARLVEEWVDRRAPGDERAFALLWHWRGRWRHLYQWATGASRRVHAARKKAYEQLAAELCAVHGTIVVDDTDYRDLARSEPAERRDEEAHETVRLHQRLASPGALRQTLEQAARARGARYLVASSDLVSQTCHACGERCHYDGSQRLTHRCEHCGELWDQDENAARNLLVRERSGDAQDPAGARAPRKRSRFDKAEVAAESAAE